MAASPRREVGDYERLRGAAHEGARGAGWLSYGLAAWLSAAPVPPPHRRATHMPSRASAETLPCTGLPAAFAAIIWRLQQERVDA